ncbi:hypothetical protein GGR54DRAFT_69190 [Hypoxylon sp. NC1633]|nr:hypothetical protein GGR54DRAFT_69190 [Hypoxylon sp. NC1633]
MSSIGPQLPPHLSKRKRTQDDESGKDSPAAKLRATDRAPANQDEIDLGSDDDDDYGPSMPQPTTQTSTGPTMPSLGPTLPSIGSTLSSIGPTLPPIGPTLPAIGPMLPTAHDRDDKEATDPRTTTNATPDPSPDDDDDEDDDDYGPALPTSTSHQARATQAREASAAARAAEAAAAPRRDDWMLAPPPAGGAYRAPDPTKLKSRRFASGPRANTSTSDAGGSGGVSSIWTETPEQKRKRLEDAVLGRGGGDAGPNSARGGGIDTHGGGRPQMEGERGEGDAGQQDRIRSFTEATRGKSLYEAHRDSRQGRALRADEEEDDPSKRAFDREKDMKLGGRVGTAQRRELVNRAADFGGRFAKGKYL